ncbi:peptide/nickel transport system ATP-binding protein [Blastococcus sp. DSM 46786]|uniref:ABC transporter ATP-binding protein n=1 Tax=Blastococcus sp. DSM 46786 TaxID=1798227 RepID=UPI0008CE7C94|nr:ABC transporter ATP-binding protein [Blastococcus sp. DSM 46786]SEL65874.1 peptide/nickel transport system ATP-binding protein [Blastococcus sp. DSM 46786]
MGDVLVSARGLEVHFPVRGKGKAAGVLRAVDGVDLDVLRGETLGLVGESGCGKSTLGNALLRLVPPTGGSVTFDGTDVTSLDRRGLKEMRRRAGMVFQDPFASLDPRRTVAQTVSEPLEVHGLRSGKRERATRVAELLELVGLDPAVAGRYPHEFSGGQRQRVGIARALAGEPDFLVCDEAIASLDVSVQAQVLNLLRRLQRQLGLTLLFISHDLSAVRHISDRIAVMYLGRIVEIGPAAAVGSDPQMPYTQALLSAVPVPHPAKERARERIVLRGDVPSPSDVPSGCRFRTRCPYVFEPCDDVDPALQPAGAPGQLAACHLHGVEGTPVTRTPEGVTADP